MIRGGIVAAMMSGALASCSNGAPPPPPPPTQVTVATPLKRDIVDWDEYIGRFEAIQDVELRPRVSGAIDRVLFTDGQLVRQGQPLFMIDPRPYRATLAQARAQTEKARATLANAQTELARAKTLLDAQAISKEEYEQKLASVRTASADVAAGQAQENQRRRTRSCGRVNCWLAIGSRLPT
ncbi:MAG: efflux RND transporter periplasmic adaptor subunit [Sphingomonas sp.]|nr:efflux RND transporter periplasmic adaptor subunit [Sphingomonas sp.]